MKSNPSLDDLWNSSPSTGRAFNPDDVAAVARRYLEHAIAPGTPLASAVRLRMHGEIKLKQWLRFTAQQVIRKGETKWQARVRLHGFPIVGSDQLIGGQGSMRWKLLGIFPLIVADGPDVTRSAAGRVAAESLWLPSLLCDASWSASDPQHLRANELELTVDDAGRVRASILERWGNPEGSEFHLAPFGGLAEEERTFGRYTIPSRLRIGWYFGTDRFESDGEFFRVTVDDAQYR